MSPDVQRTFGHWLAWSRDEDLLALLALVVAALRRRGYRVEYHVEPPETEQPG